MRCLICEQLIIIGQKLDDLKRVDGKIIHDECLVTLRAIKKMNNSVGGGIFWKGIRLDCKPYNIFKNRSIHNFKVKK